MSIDIEQTGKRLKQYINQSGYSVKDIQNYLCLSCPQPVYRWFKGKILPSVEHLFMLSRLLEVHMEDLLVQKQFSQIQIKLMYKKVVINEDSARKRLLAYEEFLCRCNIIM